MRAFFKLLYPFFIIYLFLLGYFSSVFIILHRWNFGSVTEPSCCDFLVDEFLINNCFEHFFIITLIEIEIFIICPAFFLIVNYGFGRKVFVGFCASLKCVVFH